MVQRELSAVHRIAGIIGLLHDYAVDDVGHVQVSRELPTELTRVRDPVRIGISHLTGAGGGVEVGTTIFTAIICGVEEDVILDTAGQSVNQRLERTGRGQHEGCLRGIIRVPHRRYIIVLRDGPAFLFALVHRNPGSVHVLLLHDGEQSTAPFPLS